MTNDLKPRPVLRNLLVSSRPVSWVNTAYPFAAAYLLTAQAVDLPLVIGTLFFLVPYNLMMYGINDVFDYESDVRNPRKGGAEGAVLDRSLHRTTLLAAVLLPLPFVAFLLAVGTWLSAAVLALSLFAVVAYSAPGLRFKEQPFLDSMTSSFHFTSPALFGLVLAGADFTGGLWAVLGAFFLWGMASQAFGAVQDINADREGGVASVATVLGAAATVKYALAAYALAGVLMLFTGWPGALGALLALPYLANCWPFRAVEGSRAEASNAGWKRFLWLNYVTGFFVTMLLLWYAAAR
ncbi:prenyltransferase [Arthrobacter crystallopoietes BAB-32]|uniref:Prenyltransferase n=1 Tax=Arthrobacter crystallopoietes BAB-32 TaxID=1246476 RepID=N1UXZ2_9MICC|nr:prenyltransferase [Arthrobacter crystallopoietes]EMY32649.1 prenyltransferase [Arthrobacter crystallopoietes BAB-32]